jgi:hypothetical protein
MSNNQNMNNSNVWEKYYVSIVRTIIYLDLSSKGFFIL